MNYNFFITRKMAKKIFGFLFVVFRLLILSLSLKGSRRVKFGCISKYFPQQLIAAYMLPCRPTVDTRDHISRLLSSYLPDGYCID